MCEWCVETRESTFGDQGFKTHYAYALRLLDKMDKVYPYLYTQWVAMVGATYSNNKENDSSNHRAPNVEQSKDYQNPKSWVELERKTIVKWDRRGMKINSVTNMELKFGIHVITHNIYSSSDLKSMSCEVVDMALKVVKNNMSINLAKLMLN